MLRFQNIFWVCLLASCYTSEGFSPFNPSSWTSSLAFNQNAVTSSSVADASPDSLLILGAKKRRGNLGSSLSEDGVVVTPSKTRQRKQTTASKKRNLPNQGGSNNSSGGSAGTISPDLAEWMASQENNSGPTIMDAEVASTPSTSTSKTKPKKKKAASNAKRLKQSERKEQEEQRQAQLDLAIDGLKEALEESNNNLNDILASVRQLLSLPSTNLRPLLAGKQRYNYRLAWVGSDEAICHVGTGLHKVPLARLQEVFFNCLGKNRVEILEVIRILGPFPNVKNILQGTAQLQKGSSSVDGMTIVLDSMVDGTGKEILAGTKDNIRRVNLQMYFADERAIVAVVPPEDGTLRSNPLEDDGSNVLVFLKEEELDEKLDSMRVS